MVTDIHFCMCALFLFVLCLLTSTTALSMNFALLSPGKCLTLRAAKNLLSACWSHCFQISVLLCVYHECTIYSRTEVN